MDNLRNNPIEVSDYDDITNIIPSYDTWIAIDVSKKKKTPSRSAQPGVFV